MQSLKQWWSGVLEIEGAAWIIYPSILIVLVLIAYYVIQSFRNMAIGGATGSEDYLGTFRKMRDEGMIAPDEYKKVAGLVPLPETQSAEPDAIRETGADALSEAARAALKKAASENSEEDSESSEDGESEES